MQTGTSTTTRLTQLEAMLPDGRADARDLRESWRRSVEAQVDLGTLSPVFVGGTAVDPVLEVCADRLLSERPPAGLFSVLVLDASGVVRMRRDGVPDLAGLLDVLSLSPGFDVGENRVGTTAAGLALSTSRDASVPGELHYHPQLGSVVDAAAVVNDLESGDVLAVVCVVAPTGRPEDLLLAYARSLAAELAVRISGEPSRASRAVFDRFVEVAAHRPDGVVATDGTHTFLSDSTARLEPGDLRVLTDRAIGSFVLRDFQDSEAALPSGVVLTLTLEAVTLDGETVGSVLSAVPGITAADRQAEAIRRQGAHVTSGVRRDYALEFRAAADTGAAGSSVAHPVHRLEGARDSTDLMTPYARARYDIVSSIRTHRNHLVIGEAGAGKRSLVSAEFRAEHPDGRVLTADCSHFSGDTLPIRSASGALFHGSIDDGPYLLLIGALETLTPIGARRLDEILRPLASGTPHPLLVGSVNDVTVDASKPYGLVMRYFHETIRVPPLRLRADDIGDLAREVLRKISGGNSLCLSPQATRVLEGYSWPGNVSEFEDVMRYVVARKPIGEIQARDLPSVCFNGRSRRLSMLEAAQCDAIIQALYEAKGNRYKAAAALGIARSSLYRKIDAFGISYIG